MSLPLSNAPSAPRERPRGCLIGQPRGRLSGAAPLAGRP